MMNKPIRVIIADDHQMFIDGIKALLQDSTAIQIIDEATSGTQLIEKLENCSPDVILMDIGMSGLNGIESTLLISEKFPGVKVIALTMYDDHNRIMKMLKAGAKGYILKNTSKNELIQAINAVDSGERYYTKQVIDLVMRESGEQKEDPVSRLTKRELEVIKLILKSMTNKEMAEELFLSELTVSTHRKNAMQKLGLKNTAALVKFAIDNNLSQD
jgi:two-component system, NarL family, nitrate/nitrite response regulator NarL